MRDSRGFALVSTTLILALLFAFAMVFVDSALSSRRAAQIYQSGLSALQVAEAGVHHAISCLNASAGTNCGGTYGGVYIGQVNVPLDSGKFTVVVTILGSNREITSIGTAANGTVATIKTEATTVALSSDVAFSYALQAGDEGATLQNNASVAGTLYTNGDITCQSTNAVVDGDIFVAKDGGKIDKCRAKFHGHADRILNSRIDMNAYYENDPADIAGTTVSGTKFPGSTTPAPATLPDINIEFWRTSAEEGGTITTTEYLPADNSSLGPKKIVGNLRLGQNVDLIVTGPIWVVGNIITENNSSFTLDTAFGANSTAILADDPTDNVNGGKVTIVNNTSINGSGNPLSHIMIASTNSSLSDTDPALSVANNATGAVFYALNGTMRLQSNGGAKALAAKRLYIDQNAVVTYSESGLSDLNFSNSPGGRWRIKEDTWREVK